MAAIITRSKENILECSQVDRLARRLRRHKAVISWLEDSNAALQSKIYVKIGMPPLVVPDRFEIVLSETKEHSRRDLVQKVDELKSCIMKCEKQIHELQLEAQRLSEVFEKLANRQAVS